MLSHKQLTVFTAIAEHGSITKASESLNLTQPALSSALSSLESELGVRLFDRIDRKIVLNHNGELLYPKVMQLLEDTAKIQNFFNHEQTLTGSIHIAASNTIGNYILPPLMASFKEKHPDTQLALSIGNSERVIESVVGHQADIGFIEAPCLNNQINSFAFAKDQLALFERCPKFEKYFRIITENGMISSQQRLLDNLSLPATDRYKNFINKYPLFMQRIPQTQIAAYLGITPEFLSKIRSQISKS
jgi:hypothetical protein